ncbi:hypothetical protein ACFCVO_09725 [Agromyces sp. NPDC056379]|uniref:hypothetical protein n=1 Tax=unclassified Agromyces TaxID=2639701 RepID=UPI0035DA7113
MDASTDQPQIGQITVDRTALTKPGVELASLLESLDLEVSIAAVPNDAPASGWRVLARPEHAVVLGSPVEDGSKWWRIAQVALPRDRSRAAQVQIHPEPQPLRASRAERSRGLVLRWPDVTRSEPALDHLVVDVVNTGEHRWRPDGDSFVAIGFLARAGEEPGPALFGFTGGQEPAFALDPGEYARVRVLLDANQWRDRVPGDHEITATLMDLGVRTETPLEVHLTAELIEQHQPRPGRTRLPAAEHRHAMEERLEGVRALLAARALLGSVLETVTNATSDADALLGLGELLDCPHAVATGVYNTPLRRFGSESIDRLAQEAEELERANAR